MLQMHLKKPRLYQPLRQLLSKLAYLKPSFTLLLRALAAANTPGSPERSYQSAVGSHQHSNQEAFGPAAAHWKQQVTRNDVSGVVYDDGDSMLDIGIYIQSMDNCW